MFSACAGAWSDVAQFGRARFLQPPYSYRNSESGRHAKNARFSLPNADAVEAIKLHETREHMFDKLWIS
jgi:hypothetical protein